MKRELKIGALSLLLIALLGVSFYLYTIGYANYVIITGTISGIVLIVLINVIVTTRSEESIYNSKVKQILKTYDAVLVKSNNQPKIEDKNIIIVETVEDLIDAQMELRKPIYYQQQTESCSFVLLDNNEACVFIIKQNDQVVCPLEITLNEIEIRNKNDAKKDDVPDELLKNIEKTTIVRIGKGEYLKVSPLRRKKLKEDNDESTDKENTKEIEKTEEKKANKTKSKIEEQKEEKVEAQELSNSIPEVEEDKAEVVEEPVIEKQEEPVINEPIMINENINNNKEEATIIQTMPHDANMVAQVEPLPKNEKKKDIEVLDL